MGHFPSVRVEHQECAASFPNSCSSWQGGSHIAPPTCCRGDSAMNSQLTDGATPVGHSKGVSVTEGTQISHSSPKKVRKTLALECIGCLLTAATVSSSTSHS